ncbi:MAG TPA: prolipoprotein diacylglyceryl transferase family protein [Desulfobacterales bacterium]
MEKSVINFFLSYWFWMGLGLIAGSTLSIRNMIRNGLSFPLTAVTLTAGFYTGILGTRILYILVFYPWLILEDPIHAFFSWNETGSWLGVAFTAPIGPLIVLSLCKKPFWSNMGSLVPGLSLGHAIARVGCLFAGCCFGSPTTVFWAVHSDILNTMVHPVPIYSLIGELINFAVLQRLWQKPENRSFLAPVYCMILSSHRFLTEFFRGDAPGPELIPGLRIYQSVCVIIFFLWFAIFLSLRFRKRKYRTAVAACAFILIGVFLFLIPEKTSFTKKSAASDNNLMVITREIFLEELRIWKKQKKNEGYDVFFLAWQKSPTQDEILSEIRNHQIKPVVLLIVGDCGSPSEQGFPWHIPMVKTEKIPDTDLFYGDLDNDKVPDIPVGRLPVRKVMDLNKMLRKTGMVGDTVDQSTWYRTVIWSGAKGYTDAMHQLTLGMTAFLPDWLDSFILSGKTTSVLSAYPPDQPYLFLKQFSRPHIFTYVASHGSYRSVSPVQYNDREIHLDVADLNKFNSRHPGGTLVMLGCESGRFNLESAKGLSLAEAFLHHPGGPASIISSTGSTSPLTNYYMTRSLIQTLKDPPETVGELALSLWQKNLRKGNLPFKILAKNDPMAVRLMKTVPAQERFSLESPGFLSNDVLKYHLIGDPTGRLYFPGELAVKIHHETESQIQVSVSVETACHSVFADLVKRKKPDHAKPPGLTPEKLNALFDNENRTPQLLVKKGMNGRTWTGDIPIPEDVEKGDILRIIAAGFGKSYVWTKTF